MSIQIIVATPYSFYTHWLDYRWKWYSTWLFYRDVSRYPELALQRKWVDEEYYSEDLPTKELDLFGRWLRQHHPELRDTWGADVFVPRKFDGRPKVQLRRHISGDTGYYFVSSHALLDTVSTLRSKIGEQTIEGCNMKNVAFVIDCHREAAEISIERGQPIFFSY